MSTGWLNAESEAAELEPNLLAEAKAEVSVTMRRNWRMEPPPKLFYDGNAEPPETPWVSWTGINYIDSG
jgi:hypothetical protein